MKLLIGIICFSSFVIIHGLKFKEYKQFIEAQSKNTTFVKLFEDHVKKFNGDVGHWIDFPCKPYKRPRAATTVHELTPFDIKVVAAVGDSITAGTGITAKTVIGLLREDRGQSWSIGGDKNADEHVTLPNMIKRFNPDVRGFSTGWGPSWLPNAHLNVGVPGAKAVDMPGQARTLVDKMKSNKDIDFQNDWKVITLFIGGNDLCDFCDDRSQYTVEKYIGYIQEALDIFHAEVPKAFVNLVETLDISTIPLLNEGIICDALHFFGCRCASFPEGTEKEELQDLVLKYQEAVNDLVESGRYETRDDFTVVDQPFFADTEIPLNADGSADLSYFAPDCFHLSAKGQEVAAYALWNNMIEPNGKKRRSWTPGVPVDCPNEDAPYFYTKKNSQQSKPILFLESDVANSGNVPEVSSGVNAAIIAGVVAAVMFVISVVSATVFLLIKRKPVSEDRQNITQ